MKVTWSRKWARSSQKRKQRKYRHNAPLHIRHKFVSAHLSPDLRRQFSKRSLPLRKGDEVEMMAGGFKGFRGEVSRVNLDKCKVYVEGIKIKKADGSEILRALEPSNLKIVKLKLDDKKRQMALDRADKKGVEKPEKKEEKKEKPKTKKKGEKKGK